MGAYLSKYNETPEKSVSPLTMQPWWFCYRVAVAGMPRYWRAWGTAKARARKSTLIVVMRNVWMGYDIASAFCEGRSTVWWAGWHASTNWWWYGLQSNLLMVQVLLLANMKECFRAVNENVWWQIPLISSTKILVSRSLSSAQRHWSYFIAANDGEQIQSQLLQNRNLIQARVATSCCAWLVKQCRPKSGYV